MVVYIGNTIKCADEGIGDRQLLGDCKEFDIRRVPDEDRPDRIPGSNWCLSGPNAQIALTTRVRSITTARSLLGCAVTIQIPLLLRQLRHREVSARHEGLKEIVSNTKPLNIDAVTVTTVSRR